MGEPEIQARDLASLLEYLRLIGSGQPGNRRVVLMGNSSGARLSLIFSTLFPEKVHRMVLMNMTSGKLAAAFLSRNYYQMYADAAKEGGMEKLVEMPYYEFLIGNGKEPGASGSPEAKKAYLLSLSSEHFISTMEAWAQWMLRSETWPAIGVPADVVREVQTPALVVHTYVPEEGIHTLEGAERLASMLPHGELLSSTTEKLEEWIPKVTEFVLSARAEAEAAGGDDLRET